SLVRSWRAPRPASWPRCERCSKSRWPMSACSCRGFTSTVSSWWGLTMRPLNRLQIAWRAAQDIGDGMLVNLGMGMPVSVADYLRPEADIFIQSENGVIGAGPLAPPDRADSDLVDASSRRVTLRSGAAIVDSSWSFATIRGGHI